MLIKKGSIYREIEEGRLAEYTEKGFTKVEVEEKKKAKEPQKKETE